MLRLGVNGGGCSGLAYGRVRGQGPRRDDQVFEFDGRAGVVDPKSLAYLDGTELDFVREELKEGFKFQNPNVKDECGCGESFTV